MDAASARFTGAAAERIAELMEQNHIRRVLVLKGGKLVGIVSRADLLRTVLREAATPHEARDAADIQQALARAMREQPWVDSFWVYPAVAGSVVTFHGFARNEAMREGLAVMARAIPGVSEVRDEMTPMPLILRATL